MKLSAGALCRPVHEIVRVGQDETVILIILIILVIILVAFHPWGWESPPDHQHIQTLNQKCAPDELRSSRHPACKWTWAAYKSTQEACKCTTGACKRPCKVAKLPKWMLNLGPLQVPGFEKPRDAETYQDLQDLRTGTFETYQDLRDLPGPSRPTRTFATYQDLQDLPGPSRPTTTFETYEDLRDLPGPSRPTRTFETFQDLRDLPGPPGSQGFPITVFL